MLFNSPVRPSFAKKKWICCVFIFIPTLVCALESFIPSDKADSMVPSAISTLGAIDLSAQTPQHNLKSGSNQEMGKSVADLTLNDAVLVVAEYTNNFSELILDFDESYISLDPSLQTRDERVVVEVAFWYRYRF